MEGERERKTQEKRKTDNIFLSVIVCDEFCSFPECSVNSLVRERLNCWTIMTQDAVTAAFLHVLHITAYQSRDMWTYTFKTHWQTGREMDKSHVKNTQRTILLFFFYSSKGWRASLSNVSLREEALSPFPPSRTESVGYFRHRGLFDQTPTTLRSFLTSLTSNVWHSRLAADQRPAPRRGPHRARPNATPCRAWSHERGPGRGPQRAAPPTYTASHQSPKINCRNDIRGHQEQGGNCAARVRREWGFVVPTHESDVMSFKVVVFWLNSYT